ncbi:hypothetical protein GCM10028791_28610 [Echinicola sediminis]
MENVTELSFEEMRVIDGGMMGANVRGMMLTELKRYWDDFVDGFNAGSGANC